MRLAEGFRRYARWSASPAGLVALFAAGLVLRLWLARGGGFPFDMSTFAGWANRLADRGPWGFYPEAGEEFFADYPPGYLYVLYVLGRAARAVTDGAPPVFWLKLPPVFADLGLAWLVGELAVRLAPARTALPVRALPVRALPVRALPVRALPVRALPVRAVPVRGLAVTAVLLNPAVFFISAVWGQVDSVLALLVAGAFLLLGTTPSGGGHGEVSLRREVGGMALLAVAVGTKPQGVFVLPVVILLLAWRHMRATSEDRGPVAWSGLARLVTVGGAGAAAGMALLAPFRLWPAPAFDFFTTAAGTYPVTSVFAFNLWGVAGFWRPDEGTDAFRVLGVPALYVALSLFAVGVGLVLMRAWRALRDGQDEGRVLVFGSVALTLVAFATLTRIHERYLFLAVALLAALVAFRRLAWALAGISALYFVNAFFPWGYYLRVVGRPAPELGGLFDALYGDVGGPNLKLLSVLVTVVSIGVAWRGWRWLEPPEPDTVANVQLPNGTGEPDAEPAEPVEPRPPWTLRLHAIGRAGAVLVLAAFGLALVSRLPGLGHPPGMYFDEVYYARTGAEYLVGSEVYEWTHPPLAKELVAVSMDRASGFGVREHGALPSGSSPGLIASGRGYVAWTQEAQEGSAVVRGDIARDCTLRASASPVVTDLRPVAVAISGDEVYVAGEGQQGPVLSAFGATGEAWRAPLPEPVARVAAIPGAVYLVTVTGTLLRVGDDGDRQDLAIGADAIAADARDGVVWVSFADDGRIASWDATGERRSVIEVPGRPSTLAAPGGTDRVVVADQRSARVRVVDTRAGRVQATLEPGADLVAGVPDTGLAWAVDDRRVRIIEPRGASAYASLTLPFQPEAMFHDPARHQPVAASGDGLACLGGRPTSAWRLGSAVAGSALVALVALLALRLFGSLWVAGIAALLVTVEGLAFSLSRIAMGESYVVAFILGAWFCVLSAMYRWGYSGGGERARARAIAWLAGCGAFLGMAVATKWIGLYAVLGVGGLLAWDVLVRGRDGLLGLFGGPARSMLLGALLLGALPAGIYLATYLPYLGLGHSFGDLVQLQRDMYGYHAHLEADHPFGSPWYGWPFGHRAVFMYLADHGGVRSEIWALPNLVVFFAGLVAIVALAVRARRARSVAMAVVVGAALAQYLPWVMVGRVAFIYHYLPVVPFLAIALGWWLAEGLRDHRQRTPIMGAVVGAAVVFFVVTLPMLTGWAVPDGYVGAVRAALPWVLP